MSRILVIEDEVRLARSIVRTLEESGYTAVAAPSLTEARQVFDDQVDLVVLDLMLPDGSGLTWLQELRTVNATFPVIILTARDAIPDRVAGLDAGADDYLIKPFSLDELLARIRARLRSSPVSTPNQLTVGPITADLITRTAARDGQPLVLQNRQFEFLVFLMRHANQIVDRQMIARDVWKEPTATWTNVIEVHITQLRKQLERAGCPPILHTVRGRGYVLGDLP